MTATNEQKRWMLQRMILIRCLEKRIKSLYRAGELTGAVHLCIGQEAVAVAACAALRPDDYVTSTHRGHGHTVAKGLDLRKTMAELMGRESGHCRGRGGSMHIYDLSKGFLGGNGIVGGNIAVALGVAFAAQYRGTDQVTLCFFSDGATNQGVFAECLNMAALWKLPVVYLCENNQFAATTSVQKSTCTEDVAPRAAGYGIPWAVVDGNDALEVYAAVSEAVARARAGQGATFVECKTFRIEPHCGIIADQRNKDLIKLWSSKERDPLSRFQKRLMDEHAVTQDEVAAMETAAEEEIEAAVEFARRSPFPAPETVSQGWMD